MHIASNRLFVCALVALAWLGGTSGASAQSVVLWTDLAAGPRCERQTLTACVAHSDCIVPEQSCVEFEGGARACAPNDLLFCTTEEGSPCPLDRAETQLVGDVVVCVSTAFVECPTVTSRGACFTGTDGELPVDWNHGDCDQDGQKNGVDPLPCQAASFIATLSPDSACEPSRELCQEDIDCADGSVCRAVFPGDAHEYCLGSADAAFCCGGLVGAGCPSTFECVTAGGDDFQHCHSFCTELTFEQRARCVQYLGEFPVDAEVGDCDEDGIRNIDELEGETDPCSPDDAGVVLPELDAGTNDAGQRELDAGATMDASATAPVTFSGGGGCRCGVATSQRAAMPWGLALVALALWRTTAGRRRVRRARASDSGQSI